MDDFDDERLSREFLPSAPPARHARHCATPPQPTGHAQIDGSREEQLLGADGEQSAVRVRGLDATARERVHEEMQLLASLEIAQITAAPAVLDLEEDGYVREMAPPIRHHAGRRASQVVTPPTGERHALASAREALDALIDALHEQGWVLGAPSGSGLGVRADGSVMVIDVRGLRRDRSLSARQGDRRWVDSVLHDQDRTLRRRVHLAQGQDEGSLLGLAEAPAQEVPAPDDALARSPSDPAPGEGPAALGPPDPVPGEGPAALPTPRHQLRRRRALGDAGPAPTAHGAHIGGERTMLDPVREVIRQPRLRAIALLSGALVLLVCAVFAIGAWRMQEQDAAVAEQRPSVSAAPEAGEEGEAGEASEAGEARQAPEIEDPQVLVAELAGARHAYVTGLSSQPVSAPGSPALTEDDAVREAYTGLTVVSGGPVIHAADVLATTDDEGTAVLRAVTSMEELELEERTGEVTRIPATSPVTVRLELRWNGEQWQIIRVEPFPAQEDTAD